MQVCIVISTLQAALREPLLSADTERDAIRRWQDEGDRCALELLLRSHARQVWSQALRFADNPVDLDDLVAEGMVGLIHAADNFDLKLNLRFSTYAAFWITNGVLAALARIGTVIDMPVRTYLAARAGRLQADEAGLSHLAMQGALPLDADGDGPSLSERLPCSRPDPAETAEIRSAQKRINRMLAQALRALDPTDQAIILRRRLALDPEPAETVAADLGMTVQRLKQGETRALTRLRRDLLALGFNRALLH
jgi:RNA polymerase sigma factor (sigma-70 family)